MLFLGENTIENIQLPSGWNWSQSDNRFIAYSIDGTALPKHFSILIDDTVSIKNIKLVGWGNRAVNAEKKYFPESLSLKVFPNPFNPICKISFNIFSEEKYIKIDCYNMNGHYVNTIYSGAKNVGNHQLNWYPENLASGVYFISITDYLQSQVQKVLYIK